MKTEQQRIDELISERLSERTVRFTRMDEYEWLQYKRRQTGKKLKKSRERLKLHYNLLVHKEKPSNKLDKLSYWLDRGKTIVQGVRIGYKIGDTILDLLRLRKSK